MQAHKSTPSAKSATQKKKSADAKPAKKSADAASEKTESVGQPLAAGMMKLLQEEIVLGIRNRNITDRFARFQSYAAGRVSATAGSYTGSELTGNCRIRWYNHMMQNMLAAPAEAERFTHDLHVAALDEHEGLARILSIAAEKMDTGRRKPRQTPPATSAAEALEVIKQALTEAQISYCAAPAPLNKAEISQLLTYAVPVLCTQNQVGHTLVDRGTGRQLCDLVEKMDRAALHAAAEALARWPTLRCWRNSSRCRTVESPACRA